MAWDKKYARQERYEQKNKGKYQILSIRFNVISDTDILSQLPDKDVATKLKQLIRLGLLVERNEKNER